MRVCVRFQCQGICPSTLYVVRFQCQGICPSTLFPCSIADPYPAKLSVSTKYFCAPLPLLSLLLPLRPSRVPFGLKQHRKFPASSPLERMEPAHSDRIQSWMENWAREDAARLARMEELLQQIHSPQLGIRRTAALTRTWAERFVEQQRDANQRLQRDLAALLRSMTREDRGAAYSKTCPPPPPPLPMFCFHRLLTPGRSQVTASFPQAIARAPASYGKLPACFPASPPKRPHFVQRRSPSPNVKLGQKFHHIVVLSEDPPRGSAGPSASAASSSRGPSPRRWGAGQLRVGAYVDCDTLMPDAGDTDTVSAAETLLDMEGENTEDAEDEEVLSPTEIVSDSDGLVGILNSPAA